MTVLYVGEHVSEFGFCGFAHQQVNAERNRTVFPDDHALMKELDGDRLTEKGAELAPVLMEIVRWSARYDPNTFVKDAMVNKITNGRDDFAAALRQRALDTDQ